MSLNANVVYSGCSAGECCNRNGCAGIIKEYEKEGSCSCHINPPCSYCTDSKAYCEECGWDAQEEQYEYEKKRSDLHKAEIYYYEKKRKEAIEADELFYKKWRGEIPAEKLEIRHKSHTHFSMIKYGVFPKGTESAESLLPKINGTFGGRFTIYPIADSFRFEFIAYTD